MKENGAGYGIVSTGNKNASRILVLSELDANKLGSMEEFNIFLAMELSRRGHICYLGFTKEPAPEIRALFEEAGALIAKELYLHNGERRIPGDNGFPHKLALYRFIRQNSIDLIHINFYCLTDPYLMGAYLSGARIVFTEHASGETPERGRVRNALSRAVHYFLTKRISRYIGVSDFVSNRLTVSHHVNSAKVATIYNGVNNKRFQPADRSRAREVVGLPADAKIILAVAMLIPEKGIHCLIEATALLINAYGIENLSVLVVGEGACRNELVRLCKNHGIFDRFRFLGRRSDVESLIAASDVVVVPSVWQEAFGLIVAEAMAVGRPVVASNVGGIPELIKDGLTGILAEPGDSHGIAKGIARILNEPQLAERLSFNALSKCCEQFNLSDKVLEYVNLYESILR